MTHISKEILKEKLSRLDPKVHGGEIVDFSPIGQEFPCKRELGFMQGVFTAPDDFDNMEQKNVEQLFYIAQSDEI